MENKIHESKKLVWWLTRAESSDQAILDTIKEEANDYKEAKFKVAVSAVL